MKAIDSGEWYAVVLAGRGDGRGTWRSLNALNQPGATRRTLHLL